MYLSRLRLTDVRSYESLELNLEPGTTIFLGPNGQGKTNIVEAVHYLATLNSFRTGSDEPLIRAGCETATISARVQAGIGDERSLDLAVEIRAGRANQASLNRAAVRPREILGALRTVFFAPEDLSIVQGDPARRRLFIDELVCSRWPRLAGVRADYERALKQKTALLKALSGRSWRGAGAGGGEAKESWDEIMARLGAEVVAARLRTLIDLAPQVSTAYETIAGAGAGARISYQSSALEEGVEPETEVIRQVLADRIAQRSEEEIGRGVCLVGPHRDDLSLSVGDLPVRGYASHGEAWSYALALRLASLEMLQGDGVDPVLILDDVFAELDERRRSAVVAAMASVEQSLVTAAVARDLPANLTGCIFEVTPGRVSRTQERP